MTNHLQAAVEEFLRNPNLETLELLVEQVSDEAGYPSSYFRQAWASWQEYEEEAREEDIRAAVFDKEDEFFQARMKVEEDIRKEFDRVELSTREDELRLQSLKHEVLLLMSALAAI